MDRSRIVGAIGAADTTPLCGYSFSLIDSTDGTQARSTKMPANIVHDTFQTSALITATGEYFQGAVSAIARVRAN